MTEKIILNGDLVLKTAASIKNQLQPIFENNDSLEIEFHNINNWDVSGLQLIYAAKRYCDLNQKKILFKFPSKDEEKQCKELIELINNHI